MVTWINKLWSSRAQLRPATRSPQPQGGRPPVRPTNSPHHPKPPLPEPRPRRRTPAPPKPPSSDPCRPPIPSSSSDSRPQSRHPVAGSDPGAAASTCHRRSFTLQTCPQLRRSTIPIPACLGLPSATSRRPVEVLRGRLPSAPPPPGPMPSRLDRAHICGGEARRCKDPTRLSVSLPIPLAWIEIGFGRVLPRWRQFHIPPLWCAFIRIDGLFSPSADAHAPYSSPI